MSALGLRALSIYNPGGLNDEVLRSAYLARPQLLTDLLALLRGIDRDSVATHQLIIGQRGMGKTTLLHRLALAVREEPELEARLLPLTFPEEQYSVGNLKDFWRNCLDALIDTIEARKLGDFSALQAQQDRLEQADQDAEAVLAVLLGAQQQYQRRLLLLVDNLDMLFERLDERESWSLRATLQQPGGPVLIAAATHAPEDGFRYDRAFYDFLSIRWLEALQFDEVRTLLDQLAQRHDNEALRTELARNPQRLIPLQLFTGGNPRTVVLLFRVLAQGLDEGVQKDVEDLLDLSTPLYKARIEALPLQQQRVFIAVALAFDPVTAAQVETQLKLGINTVSAQLNKLLKSGLLRHGPSAGKRLSFEVAERFFNIWYLMRANRRERHRMLWLARFLRGWYVDEPEQLASAAERLLDSDPTKALAFAVLEMTENTRDAYALRLRAALRLSFSERALYPDLKIDNENTEFHATMEIALAMIMKPDRLIEAERACLRAIEINATKVWPWLLLGVVLSQIPERGGEAEKAYRTAIEIGPKNVHPWNGLGYLFLAHPKKQPEAESAFRQAVEIDSLNISASIGLSLALILRGDLVEAHSVVRGIIELHPEGDAPWEILGVILSHQLSLLESPASNQLDPIFKAAKRRPSLPPAFDSLAKLYIKAGKVAKLHQVLLNSDFMSILMEQARPLAEAIEMLAADNPQSIASLAAEVRESTYLVLKRMAPAFAERIAREHPALVASFTLPSEIKPLQTGAN